MRFHAALVLLVLLLMCGASVADDIPRPENGNGLYAICTADHSPFQDGECMGYISAIAYTYNGIHFEIPEQANRQQVHDVVVKYLGEHPENRHEDSNLLIIQALKQAWPMSKNR